ncbi:MAG: hypothetical protein KF708_11955 [Pirellulales bacterium]|nr:hypothetical protein [Pirellulales bacterium]
MSRLNQEIVMGLLVLAGLLLAAEARADLLEELVQQGVKLPSGTAVMLPTPIMSAGMTPAEQQETLQRAADKYPLDRFTRNAVVSPFVLEINSLDDETGERRGQRIDFCFVAYGKLAAFEDEGLFDQLAGAAESESAHQETLKARALTPEELKQRGLTLAGTPALDPNFIAIDVSILDRVQLGGVAYTERAKQAGSVVAALRLDERFAEDKEFPNRWQPLLRDAAGRLSPGDPLPYTGLGGYIKVTELAEPRGALFIECHVAFDEPHGWFEGKNLLRSKMPLVVQDNVRSLRRKLASASK